MAFSGIDKFSLEDFLTVNANRARALEEFISEELRKIEIRLSNVDNSRKSKNKLLDQQKLKTTVCSEALDEILDSDLAIKDVLIEVRSEYERFVDALSQGNFQFDYLCREVKKSKTDPLSQILFQKRKEELEKRITILNENNKRLSIKIQKVNIESNKSNDEKLDPRNSEIKDPQNSDKTCGNREIIGGHSVLGKMSISGAMDIGQLVNYSSKLQVKIQKLTESVRDHYTSKSKLDELQKQLLEKENVHHHLLLYNAKLKERHENLRLASESLRGGRTQRLKQKHSTLLGAVTNALEDHRKQSPDQLAMQTYANSGIMEDDDPVKKQEAEQMMEYMDTFNEMMSLKEYDQAAKHAANSPKAILRTYDVMIMFKEAQVEGKSPAMMFCEALVTTSSKMGKMSGGLSSEIIKTALNSNRLDLASHWLTKNCFSYSLPMANQFLEYCKCETACSCGSLDIAKEIYDDLGAYRQASLCLLSTNKIHQLIQYGQDHNFSIADYVFLCKKFPSTKLLLFLMSAHPDDKIPGLISFPTAISILLESRNTTVLSEILTEVFHEGLLSADRKKKSLTDLLLAETMQDGMSRERWERVVDFCVKEYLQEIGIELLSILTVREAIDTAAYKYLLDYIS